MYYMKTDLTLTSILLLSTFRTLLLSSSFFPLDESLICNHKYACKVWEKTRSDVANLQKAVVGSQYVENDKGR